MRQRNVPLNQLAPCFRLLLCLLSFTLCGLGGSVWGPAQLITSFTIFGQVSLPDGKPAARSLVKITGVSGIDREVQTDDQGRYQFVGIPIGRYRLTATNPAAPTQFTDPVEADTSRASAGRLTVHIFLRTPPTRAEEKTGSAVISLAEATQQIPKKARQAFEEGLKHKAKQRLERAQASFDKAIQLYPGYFQALTERGEVRIGQGQVAEAAQDFAQALQFNEDYGPALRGAGYCKLEQQKFAEAVRDLEQAVLIEPTNANSYLFLGIANLALDRREPARRALAQALSLAPDEAITAHVYLADLYAREQQYQAAADELQIYLQARPQAPNAARLKALEAQFRARAKTP